MGSFALEKLCNFMRSHLSILGLTAQAIAVLFRNFSLCSMCTARKLKPCWRWNSPRRCRSGLLPCSPRPASPRIRQPPRTRPLPRIRQPLRLPQRPRRRRCSRLSCLWYCLPPGLCSVPEPPRVPGPRKHLQRIRQKAPSRRKRSPNLRRKAYRMCLHRRRIFPHLLLRPMWRTRTRQTRKKRKLICLW